MYTQLHNGQTRRKTGTQNHGSKVDNDYDCQAATNNLKGSYAFFYLEGGLKVTANKINPFIKAIDNVFLSMLNIDLKRDNPYIKKDFDNTVSVMVGFLGDLQGQVIYSFEKDYANTVISRMCGGMEISNWDEIADSALKELCNMISGQSAMEFDAEGKAVNISPPLLLEDTVDITALSIPFIEGDAKVLELSLLIS